MMVEMKRKLEKELALRGWAMKFDCKNSILDNIGFQAQMYTDPEERRGFIKCAREVLEDNGILSRQRRKWRERIREENRKQKVLLEKKFQEEGWPLKVESRGAIKEIFFETQCKELYTEERIDFIKIARKVIKK